MSSPAVGQPAPSFELRGVHLVDGEATTSTYSLAGRAAPLVLVFYPGDATPVCTSQLCSYSSGLEAYTDLGADVWAISTQGLASHERFAREHGLRVPLLADDDKTVVQAYGVARLGGRHTARSVFVLDAQGVIRWRDVRAVGLTWQKDVELLRAVAALG